MTGQLLGVPETLLITLWARAVETHRENPILRVTLEAEQVRAEARYLTAQGFRNIRCGEGHRVSGTLVSDRPGGLCKAVTRWSNRLTPISDRA